MTAIEANSRGVPVIAYNIPGVDEVVYHGKNGYLVPKNNWDAIVTTIQTSEHMYPALVASTHHTMSNYPTWQDNVQKFVSLLFS